MITFTTHYFTEKFTGKDEDYISHTVDVNETDEHRALHSTELSIHNVMEIKQKTRTIKGKHKTFKVKEITITDENGVNHVIKAFLK